MSKRRTLQAERKRASKDTAQTQGKAQQKQRPIPSEGLRPSARRGGDAQGIEHLRPKVNEETYVGHEPCRAHIGMGARQRQRDVTSRAGALACLGRWDPWPGLLIVYSIQSYIVHGGQILLSSLQSGSGFNGCPWMVFLQSMAGVATAVSLQTKRW